MLNSSFFVVFGDGNVIPNTVCRFSLSIALLFLFLGNVLVANPNGEVYHLCKFLLHCSLIGVMNVSEPMKLHSGTPRGLLGSKVT